MSLTNRNRNLEGLSEKGRGESERWILVKTHGNVWGVDRTPLTKYAEENESRLVLGSFCLILWRDVVSLLWLTSSRLLLQIVCMCVCVHYIHPYVHIHTCMHLYIYILRWNIYFKGTPTVVGFLVSFSKFFYISNSSLLLPFLQCPPI